MRVRLMYLQSGAHWKHFSPVNHSFLALLNRNRVFWATAKSTHPKHETDGCLYCEYLVPWPRCEWMTFHMYTHSARSISFNKRNYSFIVRFIQIPVHLEFSWVLINGVALPLLRWSGEEKNVPHHRIFLVNIPCFVFIFFCWNYKKVCFVGIFPSKA